MPHHVRVALALLAAVAGFGARAAGAGNDSVFTDLALEACSVTNIAKEDEAGNTLPRTAWYTDQWRCLGHGGWAAFVTEGDLRAGVLFSCAAQPDGDFHFFAKFSVAGPKVEWRGPRRGGTVVPEAAIFRYRWASDGRKGSVLAVARLGRGASDTCIFAYIDAVANLDANRIAQQVADERAARTVCADRQPEWVGKVSANFR